MKLRCALVCHLPNFLGEKFQFSSNFNFDEWEHLVHTDADRETVSFFRYGFPASYPGSVPTPSDRNHPSSLPRPRGISKYIVKEVSEGAMLVPSEQPPFPSMLSD